MNVCVYIYACAHVCVRKKERESVSSLFPFLLISLSPVQCLCVCVRAPDFDFLFPLAQFLTVRFV